jgi:hypothetical protein
VCGSVRLRLWACVGGCRVVDRVCCARIEDVLVASGGHVSLRSTVGILCCAGVLMLYFV